MENFGFSSKKRFDEEIEKRESPLSKKSFKEKGKDISFQNG
jgi:hypothetical protein